MKNQKIEKAGTFLLYYLIVTLRSQEKGRRFFRTKAQELISKGVKGLKVKSEEIEASKGRKSSIEFKKFVFMFEGRNLS